MTKVWKSHFLCCGLKYVPVVWAFKLRWVFTFLKINAFLLRVTNLIFECNFLIDLKIFKFKIQDFELKIISSKSQKVKTNQNHTFTNHGVVWLILKSIKIRDQGMEMLFLCYVFNMYAWCGF